MSLLYRSLALLSLLAALTAVWAVPSFEGVTNWSEAIGTLVPGMTALEALGPYGHDYTSPHFFSIDAPHGNPGNVTVKRETSPPLFYIHNGQLWHYHNGTTILPVAVRNSTASAALPLQLSVGKGSRDAVRGGSWRWQGTMLYYEQGSASNSGAYYSCQDTNGLMGLFTFLRPSPTPPGCTLFTVHSFTRH